MVAVALRSIGRLFIGCTLPLRATSDYDHEGTIVTSSGHFCGAGQSAVPMGGTNDCSAPTCQLPTPLTRATIRSRTVMCRRAQQLTE